METSKYLWCPSCLHMKLLCGSPPPTNRTCGECAYNGEFWLDKPPLRIPRTQKAIGLKVLSELLKDLSITSYTRLFQSLEEVEKLPWPPGWKKMFARPCPVRPRHGFVDSRVVTSTAELLTVMKETLDADPAGELMLVPLIDAKWNAVWTPSLLTMGKGHDGATAGKDVVMLPLGGHMPFKDLSKAGIGPDDDPYIEVVGEIDCQPTLTQLRAGPKGDSRVDFIPDPCVVREILSPNQMDLLAWEALIKEKKDVQGVVVNNVGGSPADHYSVHGRSYNIPVITSRVVAVGDCLEPVPFQSPSPLAVLKGIAAGDAVDLTVNNSNLAVYTLLLALHGSARMEGDQGKWLGMGVSLMLRLGASAIRGEARHINQSHPERTTVYKRCLPHTIRRHRAALPRLVNILRYGDFGGGGIGGRKWAECGGALAALFDAVGVLARAKDAESVNSLLRVFNTAVNQAHNGGWWLNKFAPHDCFDAIQKGTLSYPVRSIPFLLDLDTIYKNLPDPVVDRKFAQWEQWEPVQLRHNTIQSVGVSVIPGLPGISFTFTDKLLRGKHRPMVVPTKDIFDKLFNMTGGDVFVVPTEDGLSVQFRKDGQPEVVLWKEKGVKDGGQSPFSVEG